MKEFSVVMALVDYIPCLLFVVAIVILQRDLYNKMSKGAFALFSAGTIYVALSGILKATYKLLYGAGICDFEPLSQMFFPTQSISFVLAGLGLVAMMTFKQEEKLLTVVAPVLYKGTMIFVSFMVLGLAAMDAVLAILAGKLKKKSTILLFVVSFFFSLSMGYLSTKDFSKGFMNWIGEGVNIVAMLTFLLGTLSLHKAGLKDLKLK